MSIGAFGGVLGAAVILVNLLGQTELPHINIPEHPPLGHAIVIGVPGFLSGLLVTGPIAYWLLGPPSFFNPDRIRPARALPIWVGIGLTYTLVMSLVLGGLFLPISFLFTDFTRGALSVPNLLSETLDTLLAWPGQSLVMGIQLLFTAMAAGVLFGLGAWVIDQFNSSADSLSAKYGTWVVALALCGLVLAILAVIPGATLARLG